MATKSTTAAPVTRTLPVDPATFADDFAKPPASARPWVYWFWNNGNVTHAGITADLEAMQRVGIGGVIIMDVVERFAPPRGPATFMGETWRDDFQFALSEAARLGLEVNMTNAAGWCGSSGPWITPELSMQQLVTTETPVEGPTHFAAVVPNLPPNGASRRVDHFDSSVPADGFYRGVAVLAFPATGDGTIARESVIDLTSKLDNTGRLTWDVPPGKWTIQRIGHVSTGASTRPPVLGGNGLECDKLSAAAMDLHFAHFIAKLKADAGPAATKALVATHIDSWESGSQNWTETFPAEFQRRRGYNVVPFLPAFGLDGKTNIDSRAVSDRFRWDFYQTLGDMLVDNYSGRLATLAHGKGLRLTMEGYDLPFGDEATYTAAADEPMTEFWTESPNVNSHNPTKALEMASVAHVFGHSVVGAEAFTSGDHEMWKLHPALLKVMGDNFFAQGVNRFVVHRYAHQPWLDRAPGSTMGPWGLHYERTNTWWELSGAWHEYVARCQYALRQGHYVADVLFLRPQYPNQTYYNPMPLPAGYRSDQISATALIDRISVKDGRLTLPDGMNYRLLVMPPVAEITPELAEKVRDLVNAGAAVLGPRPTHAPGLTDYPNCDRRVASVAEGVWGQNEPGVAVDRPVGQGRVFSAVPLNEVLQRLATTPDFVSSADVNWIHRTLGSTDLYFVANPAGADITSTISLRLKAANAQRWDPETGERSVLPIQSTTDGRTNIQLNLGPTQSCFVVLSNGNLPTAGLVEQMGPTTQAADLSDNWDVAFPLGRGAPDHVHMPSLASLSDSADFGIQHFSGIADYTRTFNFTPDGHGHPVLDLGTVAVMARVSVNGKVVGTAWKPPYLIDLQSAVHPGVNQLKIEVADLWTNRLIGDASLPVEKRIGWCTWEPFKANMSLVPSGLIGPVRLMSAN